MIFNRVVEKAAQKKKQVRIDDNLDADTVPSSSGRKILLIVENLSVPFDRRVWQECLALSKVGYTVTVISPKDATLHEASREVIEGITIYRYVSFQGKGGFGGYVLEYLIALVKSFWLMNVALVREGFDVIQICNPPDLLILIAAPFKLFGKRIVFDQHDVCPELYQAQKNLWNGDSVVLMALSFFERLTYAFADIVLVVNNSCREVALLRGKKPADSVFVVRNGPTIDSLRDATPDYSLKEGKEYLLVFVGMMGPQDGVDVLLRVIRALVVDLGRHDFHVRLLGSGTALDEMKSYAAELGVSAFVTFAGRVDHANVLKSIATADVGLCPDPKTPLSDKCSLVKTIEYMSLGKPFVSFNLDEVRYSARNAALFAESDNELEFACLVDDLLNSSKFRQELGANGRRRVVRELAWDHSVAALLSAYEAVFGETIRTSRDGEVQ